MSTTVVNAYVAPVMMRYLSRLDARLRRSDGDVRLRVMRSNGGSMSAAEAGRDAVRTVLSGPAGGVVGALAAAQAAGVSQVISFDMGGTSTDVSLCPGRVLERTDLQVDGLPNPDSGRRRAQRRCGRRFDRRRWTRAARCESDHRARGRIPARPPMAGAACPRSLMRTSSSAACGPIAFWAVACAWTQTPPSAPSRPWRTPSRARSRAPRRRSWRSPTPTWRARCG